MRPHDVVSHMIDARWDPNGVTFNCMMQVHVNPARTDKVLQDMIDARWDPNGITFNCLMRVDVKPTRTKKVLQREIEHMKNDTAELKMEAAVTKLVLQDVDTKLRVALEEVEAANAVEASVVDQIKVLSMRTSHSHSSPSEPGARITISREEFESLLHKVKESDKLADIKVFAATAQPL
ncbi:hypothetical protein JHK87_033349 [Glycine soja]|nr:hypothetical protein JHK87_033349 [Glycine soja]